MLVSKRFILFFNRVVIHKRLYTTCDYAKQFKQNNSFCMLRSNKFCQIISILIVKWCNCIASVPCICQEAVVGFVKMLNKHVIQSRCFDDFVEDNLNKYQINCLLDEDLHAIYAKDIV